jgi:acetyl esterase/lipase
MKQLFLYCLMAFICVFSFSSCDKDGAPAPVPEVPLTALTLLNQSYGTDAAQNYDVYLPAGRGSLKTKTVILIHGGSWSGGDKADMTPFVAPMQSLWPEVAFVNINYRLANATGNKHPAQINDITSLINFVKSKKTEWNITDTFGIIGASAGAHLSLLWLANNPTQQNVKVMGDVFGPTSFLDAAWMSSFLVTPTVENYLGTPFATNPTLWAGASPLNKVTASFVPTIIFHGTADIVVPVRQSDSLDLKFTALGVPHSYTKYAGDGHGFTAANNADMVTKMVAYFKQYLR